MHCCAYIKVSAVSLSCCSLQLNLPQFSITLGISFWRTDDIVARECTDDCYESC